VRRRPRQSLDVRGQRRVVLPVIGRMVADDVDHARSRLVGVVNVCQPVGQPRPQMQQGGGGLVAHPVVAVGGAGHHPLEQPEHAAHPLDPVERRDEVHLAGPGIGKANVNPTPDQRPHQTFRPVHRTLSGRRFKAHPAEWSGPGQGAPTSSRCRRMPGCKRDAGSLTRDSWRGAVRFYKRAKPRSGPTRHRREGGMTAKGCRLVALTALLWAATGGAAPAQKPGGI
jgi:hypothetical protein